MSNAPDPVRWFTQDGDLPDGVRTSFARYADLGPDDQQRARMFERVVAEVSEKPAPARRWGKLWLGAGLLAAGLALWRSTTWQATDGSGDAPGRHDELVGMASRSKPVQDAPAPPARVTQDEPSESLLGPVHEPRAEREVHPREEVVERQTATPTTSARPVRQRRRGDDEPLATPSPPAQAPAEELALLTRARSLLVTASDAALSLTEEHRTRFPRGTFVEERELIAVEALARLGRAEEAVARGKAFLARYARSAHAERMRVILQGLTGEAAPTR